MEDKALKKFISDIKRDLLFYIITNMKEEKTTFGSAKYLAKDFLALLPAKDKGDALDKLYSLTRTYQEARAVFAKYVGPYEEEKTRNKLENMRKYMQVGDYDRAVQIAKGVN